MTRRQHCFDLGRAPLFRQNVLTLDRAEPVHEAVQESVVERASDRERGKTEKSGNEPAEFEISEMARHQDRRTGIHQVPQAGSVWLKRSCH